MLCLEGGVIIWSLISLSSCKEMACFPFGMIYQVAEQGPLGGELFFCICLRRRNQTIADHELGGCWLTIPCHSFLRYQSPDGSICTFFSLVN
jgi:hypothetical protein